MPFKINYYEDSVADKIYNDSFDELNEFFEINWVHNRPNFIVFEDRLTIDKFLNEKSEPWVIGFTSDNNVCILDKKNFNRDSCHKYSDHSIKVLVKHELAHSFYSIISNNYSRPVWLWEGVAIYLSEISENNPIEKFSNVLKFYDIHTSGNESVYTESGFLVKKLISKFGKQKLFKLITKSNNLKNVESFNKLFKEIYNIDLSYNNINKL